MPNMYSEMQNKLSKTRDSPLESLGQTISSRCPIGSGEEDFKGFYHIWAWRPSWSCDPNSANKLSLPLSKEHSHQFWL